MGHKNSVVNIANQRYLFTGRLPRFDSAACYDNGIDPEAFFPMPRSYSLANKKAKALCKTCPVMDQCLDYALKNDIWFGIWGGKTAAERNEILGKTSRGYNGHAKTGLTVS